MIEEKKKSSVGKVFGFIILMLAFLAIGAGASYYYLTSVKNITNKETTDKKEEKENVKTKKETLDNNDPLVQSLFSKMIFQDNFCEDHIYKDDTNTSLDNNIKLELSIRQIPEKDFDYYNYNCKESDLAFNGSAVTKCSVIQEHLNVPAYSSSYPIKATSESLFINKGHEIFGSDSKIELTSFVGNYLIDYIYTDNKFVRIHPWGVGGTCGPDSIIKYALESASKEGDIITFNLNITLGEKVSGSQVMRFEKNSDGFYIFKDVKSNNDYTDDLKNKLNTK